MQTHGNQIKAGCVYLTIFSGYSHEKNTGGGGADSTDPCAVLLTPKEGSSVTLSKQIIRKRKSTNWVMSMPFWMVMDHSWLTDTALRDPETERGLCGGKDTDVPGTHAEVRACLRVYTIVCVVARKCSALEPP